MFPAAVYLDGVIVGDPDLVPGTRAASSGTRVLLFATGVTASTAGTILDRPIQILRPMRVLVGDKEAVVEYVGVISPGLFQINVLLPELVPGRHALVVEADGEKSPPGPTLPVK